MSGTLEASISSVTPLARAISQAWPSSEKPVTSVAACAPASDISRAAREQHRLQGRARHLLARLAELDARGDDARADRLGQDERVARARAAVGDDARGVNRPRHGVAEHDLLVVDAVAADERHAVLG